MTKKIVSLVLFVVVLIASFGSSIYATVQASQQRALYNEQIHYVEKYQEMYDKAVASDNPIIGSLYFKNLYQQKTEEAQTKADEIKKVMRKYFAFSAVLMFVALAMLVCTVATAMPLVKMKKADGDAEDKPKRAKAPKKVEQEAQPKRELPKSDFDIILEVPKPHITDEE